MARQRTPVWIVLAAAIFLAYFALLIYVHVHRPGAGPAATAGLSRVERDARDLTLPLGPASFDIERDGVLYALRAVQLVTLGLAVLIAVRRPTNRAALFAAWLLAAAGVFSVALPAGWAAAWQSIPAVSVPLWLPFISTTGTGAILFLFAAHFTNNRRALAPPALAALAALTMGPVIARTASRMSAVYGWTLRDTILASDWALLIANVIPAIGGILLLHRHYSRTGSVIEKRRARLVLGGGSIGLVAGIAVMAAAASWPQPERSFFASTSMTAGMVILLLFPLSLAYAVLRYRLFDLGAAIRLGLRYAAARRALLSIVPLALGALALDIWSYGDRPLRDVVASRAWVYVAIAAAAIAAHVTRHRWLDHLDRTFFRERYDATRILMDLVGELRGGKPFDQVASLAVARIEHALHPAFVVAGTAGPGGPFATSAAFRPEKAPGLPPPASTLMDVARALKRPMDVGPESAPWLAERLPEHELTYLREGRIEVLVPITSSSGSLGAVMLLGPKQSEEPYTQEDRDLLGAIADSLALTLTPHAERPQLKDVELPRVLGGRYRLDRVIGRGGMGVVYEGRDLTLDRPVAVKLMRDELVDSTDARRRFEHEARAAAGFSHPNVITVFDFNAKDDGVAMIVMELLEGRTLREALDGSPWPVARALDTLRRLADAIDAAHARGLLHRDLKPENVFLCETSGGTALKILDFGIARAFGRADRGTHATLDGVLLGTPRYMAPEQLAGGEPAPAWDLWALSVLAYEMLTGAHPFAGARPAAKLPPALEAVFTRALAQRTPDRFDTAREFVRALEDAADDASV